MTEYEKLVLKALAQMLRVLADPQNERERYDSERIANEHMINKGMIIHPFVKIISRNIRKKSHEFS